MLFDLPEPEHDPDRVRQLADEILSRPEYRWGGRSIFDRVGDWIAEQLGRLLAPLGLSEVPVWLGWVVLAALIGLVAWLVARSRPHWRRGGRPVPPDAGSRVVISEAELGVDWAAEAWGHEAAGRWREALRCRYRALVAELARRGAVDDLAGRTAGELVAEVAATRPAARAAFASATARFESAWYGARPVGQAELDAFVALADEVLALAGTGPAGRGGGRPVAAVGR